jgi:hypothetical protein
MVSSQEFHISVTPVGQNDYLVRTEQVAPGVPLAEELVTWPVAEWLAAAGHLMDDPLELVFQGDESAHNSVNLVALGQELYNTLFRGSLRDSWITAQGIAQNQQQVLRLRLGLKDTKLARLPWEVMHAGDRPLATGPYVSFSRYQSGLLNASRLPVHNLSPLSDETVIKVLMVISAPSDLARLDLLRQEAINLQAELNQQTLKVAEAGKVQPRIELTLLDQPGREELTQALEQGRFHILHYSGHSNIGPNGGEIYLVSRRTGLTETLSGDDLAGLLVNNNIQMAVFNSCLGAYRAKADPTGETGERNLTESLVRRGVSSVLAMSERIPDEVALTLTQLFYRNLGQGYPLDLCVSRVRQGLISAYGSQQMYWALPILYLQREFDGFLTPQVSWTGSVDLLPEFEPPVTTATNPVYATAVENPNLPLVLEDMIPPTGLEPDPSGLDWLEEDAWGDILDEIEYNDPSYDEDSAIVSDLFRQLNNSAETSEETAIMSELLQQEQEDNSQPAQVTDWDENVDLWADVPNPKPPVVSKIDANPVDASSSPAATPTHLPKRPKLKLWQMLGLVGASVMAMAIGVGLLLNQRPQVVPKVPELPNQNLSGRQLPPINLKTASTGIIAADASQKLSQGNLQSGLESVEELVNRGALDAAVAALQLLPAKAATDPSVNFLRGRIAWQFVQKGDSKYSIDDARRYWETAVRERPDSLLYNNALGFAYYAEGKLDLANDAWFKALNVAVKQENPPLNVATGQQTTTPVGVLTSYAGLALGLYKSVNTQPAAKQGQYLKEAIKLRQMVLENGYSDFTVDALSRNWLWTQDAIADWRSLLQAGNNPNQAPQKR